MGLNYKGTLKVYSGDKLIATFHNSFVISGRMFALDAIWGVGTDWITTGSWKPRYAGIGTSTEANNIPGPLNSVDGEIANTGGWQGSSIYDWKLYEEETTDKRPVVTVTREDRTVEMEAIFTDTNCLAGDYFEMGLFLDKVPGTKLLPAPSGDASETAATDAVKATAMLARVIFYREQSGEYFARPITKTAGENLTMRYIFQDV